MIRQPADDAGFSMVLASLAAAIVLGCSSTVFGASLGDPDYKEGFGKNATGGAGGSVCTVTSTAASGTGTLFACLGSGGSAISNRTIQFAVSTTTLPQTVYLGSHLTIDGCLNGQNGVTMNVPATGKKGLSIENGSNNIIIRCMNFRSTGTPNSNVTEFDLVTVDGTNSSTPVDGLFVDRCTFMQASDGALDLTGNVRNVTIQRSLFYNNAITMLIKYNTRQNISLHHNVFTRNGERNPQVKGDMRLLDFVNNVISIRSGDVPNYPDGGSTDPYGLRIWNAASNSDSPGNVTINVVGNVFLGDRGNIDLTTDSGASASGVHIGANLCAQGGCPTSPRATPNAVPSGFAVTTLGVGQLRTQMLPYIGAPNRTALDIQRLDEVGSALPSTGSDGTPPAVPTGLTIR